MKLPRLRLLVWFASLMSAFTASLAQSIEVDPLTRFQTWYGIGGTCRNGAVKNYDYDRLVEDLGLNVHRTHLESLKIDAHIEEGKLFAKAARRHGRESIHIASLWSPEPDFKIGPYHANSIRQDGRWSGGSLNPKMYDAFARDVIERVQRYKDAGIDLKAICLQNEPWLSINYASCTYTWEQYEAMLEAVVPPFKEAHPDVMVIAAEMAFAIGGDNNLFARFIAEDRECEPLVDVYAYHGQFPGFRWGRAKGGISDEDAMDPRPGGTMSEAYRERLNFTRPRENGWKPHWQTESNWARKQPTWLGPDGAWKDAACILTFIRDMYGQLWTTYEFELELINKPERYKAWKHFGHFVEPGSVVVRSGYDAQAGISSVAFHDQARERLTLVLLNMGEGTDTTRIVDEHIRSRGQWFLSDESTAWKKMGELRAGEPFEMTGFSIATVVFEDYDPDLSRARHPLK